MITVAALAAIAFSADQSLAQPVTDEIEVEHRFGLKAPKEKPAFSVRLAAYNVENLFDPFDDPSLEGEWDDEDEVTARERCESIADVIRTIDADVIALQEIESLEALEWFRDEFLSDMRYDYLASKDVGYYRGVECSVMSRFPITKVEVRPGISLDDVNREGPGWDDVPPADREGMTIQRSPLRADIQINDDYRLTVFSVHHKSGGRYRYKREAEAIVINEWLDEIEREDPSRNIVVMGDFNAAPWDKSARLYLQNGFVDTLAHRIIPRWRDADQTEAKMYKTHRSDRVIDFVLMNSAAYREYIPGTAHVFGTPTAPEGWNWREDPYPLGYASDHFPVIVDMLPGDRE